MKNNEVTNSMRQKLHENVDQLNDLTLGLIKRYTKMHF